MLWLSLLTACDAPLDTAAARLPCAPGWSDEIALVDGVERRWRRYLPDGDGPHPAVIAFHGMGGSEQALYDSTGVDTIAAARGWALAVPEAAADLAGSAAWNAGACCDYHVEPADDVGFARAIADDLAALECVDSDRRYAIGESNGGMLVYRLACEAADRFAGLGVGIGTLAMDREACAPSGPVSLIHVHGDADDVVSTDGQLEGVLRVTAPADAAAWIAESNGCLAGEEISLGDATCQVYSGCEDEVRYCLVPGMDHDWPVEEVAGFDGTGAMLDFFDGAR